MHYAAKLSPSRLALRKATRALLGRNDYPAWQDAAGEGPSFSSALLLPRLRAQLARRAETKATLRSPSHATGQH